MDEASRVAEHLGCCTTAATHTAPMNAPVISPKFIILLSPDGGNEMRLRTQGTARTGVAEGHVAAVHLARRHEVQDVGARDRACDEESCFNFYYINKSTHQRRSIPSTG